MLGRSHVLSAGVGWLSGCAILESCGVAVPGVAIGAGALVSAGFGLLPDIDHPGSTVSRTLGPATRVVSTFVVWAAVTARAGSCTHCARRGGGGHRGLTHTTLGAFTVGLLVTVCAWMWPRPCALTVIGFGVWLAAHTALSSTTRARIGDMVLPGRFRRHGKHAFRFTAGTGAALIGVAAAYVLADPAVTSWWWLGIPVAWGCLAHSLGDALTFSAVPLWWPARIRGCRWTPVGTPRWMRFRTGSRTETVVVVLMAVAGLGAVTVLAGGVS